MDGVLVEEVLANLIENAARYTPRRSTIRIAGAVPDGAIRIVVEDDGPGLPPGTETLVFDKFYRSRPSTDRGGTGLGLAISRAIVRLHGGEIGAENRPEGGARFWFTIPLADNPPPTTTMSANRERDSGAAKALRSATESPA